MENAPSLKTIGYWRGGGQWRFPRPQWFVRPGWRADDRDRILGYLRSGHRFASWMGFSFCRFNCDISPPLLGDSDLTDGEWVRPAGLAHYVEAHSVMLPDDFVRTMMRNGWLVPASAAETRFGPYSADRQFDFTFWLAWSRRNARRPWYWPW